MRVLIVDDDSSLCELMADMLDETILEPVCVHSDREAYNALRDKGPFAALITDVNLGQGTTGFDVGRAARQFDPGIAVVYASGDATAESFRMFGVAASAFLPKPFAAEALHKVLEEQLHRSLRKGSSPEWAETRRGAPGAA